MLTDKLQPDLKEAIRAKDIARLSALRMLKSALEYYKMEKNTDKLSDADAVAVIRKQIKQGQDAIAEFEKGGRSDLVNKERAEMAVLKSYLPQELSQVQIEEIVQSTIAEVGATTKADMGKVMKAAQAKISGRADNRLVSQIVLAKLT